MDTPKSEARNGGVVQLAISSADAAAFIADRTPTTIGPIRRFSLQPRPERAPYTTSIHRSSKKSNAFSRPKQTESPAPVSRGLAVDLVEGQQQPVRFEWQIGAHYPDQIVSIELKFSPLVQHPDSVSLGAKKF